MRLIPSRDFEERVAETRDERARVRKLVEKKIWRAAEPDPERRRAFAARRAAVQHRGAEALQGSTNDLQPVSFLVEGFQVRRAVGFVEVNDPRGSTVGSGFLISPQLFLTNCHVIQDAVAAQAAQITFDRELTPLGRLAPSTTYSLDPARFALFSEVKSLDYALVAIGERVGGNASIEELGFCPLSDTPDRHVLGMHLNIIQHPNGLPKMIAFRENILTARTDRTMLYDTDTDVGSSGSPVFNDTWDVVALHHWGEPFLEKVDEEGNEIPVTVNEGVRISAVHRDLSRQLAELDAVRRELLAAALLAFDRGPATVSGRRLGPPRPNASEALSVRHASLNQGVQMSDQNSLRFMLPPMEVSIRFVQPATVLVQQPSQELSGTVAPDAASHKLVRHGAEAIHVDEDYSNRNGYDPTFIPGLPVALPEPNGTLAKQIAPLRAGEPDAAAGELKYQNFSINLGARASLCISSPGMRKRWRFGPRSIWLRCRTLLV